MGTNYYRIPTESEMQERKARLEKRIQELEMTAGNIERKFNTIPTHDSDYVWEYETPWDEFCNNTNINNDVYNYYFIDNYEENTFDLLENKKNELINKPLL